MLKITKAAYIERINCYEFVPFDLKDNFALFSSSRIDRSDIPEDLYVYELRHDSKDDMELCQVKDHIIVNFYGTIVTNEPLDFVICSKALRDDDWGYLTDCCLNYALMEIMAKIVKHAERLGSEKEDQNG